MIHDLLARFSNAQDVTASAASTDHMNLGEDRNIGAGENLYLVVNCDTAMTDSGSDSTVAVTLETDDNSSFSSATSAQTIGTFSALSAAGTQLIARIQPNAINEQYLRVYYTVANGNLTTGAFSAYITHSIPVHDKYADNVTISAP